jgi:hypothetical protein
MQPRHAADQTKTQEETIEEREPSWRPVGEIVLDVLEHLAARFAGLTRHRLD